MYRKILVPLDGSIFSERALPLATTIARATDGTIELVRAAWMPSLPAQDPIDAQVRAVREARAYLEAVGDELRAQGLDAELSVPFALADAGILREIGRRQADVVIMASHRKPTPEQKVYGSVAQAVLAKSPVPVIVMRVDEAIARPETKTGGPEILVPLDGSSFAEAAVPFAADLARALGWTLVLLRVLPDPNQSGIKPATYLEEEARAVSYLVELATPLRHTGLKVQTEIKTGSTSPTILRESETRHTGLIAMATHGLSGVQEMLFGSVTMDVLRNTQLPLMLVRPPQMPPRPARAADLGMKAEDLADSIPNR